MNPRPHRRSVRWTGSRDSTQRPVDGCVSKASRSRRQEGLALVVAVTAVAILGIMLVDMHQSTGTAFAVSTAQRDALQAEYLAKSATNLTRLLISQEPKLRQFVAPFYRMAVGKSPPQLPVWKFANELLAPFCTPEEDRDSLMSLGIDFGDTTGFDELPGGCEVVAASENSKINVNKPLMLSGDMAKSNLAVQVFALTGGYQPPGGPYDFIFSGLDPDGNITTRLDLVSALIDWWDSDTQLTDFDPGEGEVRSSSSGSENATIYQLYDDPYRPKNAPFDSLQELRLVRGFTDDFWAAFVEPIPDDPESRRMTIYSSGMINVNEADPLTLLARICSVAGELSLCTDEGQSMKFVQVLKTVKSLIPIPLFAKPNDFVDFLQGKGEGKALYPMLQGFLGDGNELLFAPVTLTEEQSRALRNTLTTSGDIFTIVATSTVGRSKVEIESVVNFNSRWVPPPPNAGTMPGLGVFHYYRVD
jgi:general secretion pathway protein K